MELENGLTSTMVIDYLVNKQVEEKGISKTKAKLFVLNALLYNVVIEALEEQIDFLCGELYEQ